MPSSGSTTVSPAAAVGREVAERVEHAVALVVGPDDRAVVGDLEEPGAAAAVGDVEAVRAARGEERRVGRGEERHAARVERWCRATRAPAARGTTASTSRTAMYLGQFPYTCSSQIVVPSASLTAWPLSRIRRRVLGSSASPPTAPSSALGERSPGSGVAATCTASRLGVVMKPGAP